jgi:hypothetical protein
MRTMKSLPTLVAVPGLAGCSINNSVLTLNHPTT